MNDSKTGRAIGSDTIAAQVAAGVAYLAAHPITAEHKFFTEAELSELALEMAQIAGNAVITHAPGWDAIPGDPRSYVEDGEVAAGVDRPMPALVQQVDGGGATVAVWLKTGAGRTEWTQFWPSFPGFYEDPPEDVGITSPGDSPLVPHGNHSHGPGDPAATGGKLYTAYIQDPLAKGQIAALYTGYDVCGAGFLFGSAWTEGPTGTWTRVTAGVFPSAWVDDYTPQVNDLLLAWNSGLDSSQLKYAGPYEVLDIGDAVDGHAVVRRVDGYTLSANFVNGMWFEVLNGTVHAGEFWQLTIPTPFILNLSDQEWSSVPAPTVSNINALLTAAQIGRASRLTITGTATVANGDYSTLVECTTVDGLLSGQTLVAGQPWECHLKVKLTADDPAATTQVVAYLASTSGSFVELARSAALHNESYETLVFAGTFSGDDYGIPIGEELLLRFRATSTSTTGVELNFIFNESDHPSWIQTPLTLGFAGTDRHDELTPASRALPNQHPADAIGPGRLHRNMGTIAVDENGYLTFPIDASRGRVSLGVAPLSGIVPTGFTDGDPLLVFVGNASVASPKHVLGNVETVAPAKPLRLAMKPSGGPQPLQLNGPTTLLFWYDESDGSFRLQGMVIHDQ